ncbi:hypothetical protein KSI01_06530 [Kurthia sibirica]|uniref:Uncharacterized protein n=2 Tax=Kurthia sibirica TaxID=202750 RepID=A0A2U3AKE4_9BACL|nr:hypothetical protein DEX24_10390 [Kurthia sibirica]GEK33120.1 hypothetical protein KSI01_06530 [Kurthia sibirica]
MVAFKIGIFMEKLGMKKWVLLILLIFIGSYFSAIISPQMNVQASSAFTKSEVKAIKKGTFVHAKAKGVTLFI